MGYVVTERGVDKVASPGQLFLGHAIQNGFNRRK